MPGIADLLERQGVDLERLSDREAARVLRIYDDARRELREKLLTPGSGSSVQRTRVLLAQAESAVGALRDRVGEQLAIAARSTHETSVGHLLEVIDRHQDLAHEVEIENTVLARLTDTRSLAHHATNVDRYGAELASELQRQIAVGFAQGEGIDQIAERLTGAAGSVFSGMRGRAELLVRMELSRAYDEGHQAALEEVAAYDDPQDPDPLLKRADEFRDGRNHPFSLRLDGRAVLPRQEWEVPITDPAQRRGLVWRVTDGIAHGFGYPAHYHERGRQVPWRPSWDGQKYQPQRSFREKDVDVGTLRALSKGEPVADVDPAHRNVLELSGFVDGLGRLTPSGKEALNKQVAGLPGPVPKAQTLAGKLRRVEAEIRDLPEEHAVLFTKDGRELRTGPAYTRREGHDPTSAVAIPPSWRADGKNATHTHNHPSGLPLSSADFDVARWLDVRETRATRPGAGTWSAVRPKGGWPERLSVDVQAADDAAQLAAAFRMNDHIAAVGGDPADGTSARGFSQSLWEHLVNEESEPRLRAVLRAYCSDLVLKR